MPELPEVEVLSRQLKKSRSWPSRIEKITFLSPKLRTELPKKTLNSMDVIKIFRRSKFLIFECSDLFLVSHLGMSGSWRMIDSHIEFKKHDHIIIKWDDGIFWVYNDPRRFGIFEITPNGQANKWIESLGIEPLVKWTEKQRKETFSKFKMSSRSLKSLIMDSKIIVGVGNIYASEALFAACLSPIRSGNSLTIEEFDRLVEKIRMCLKKAIVLGGSTLKDYRHANGKFGQAQSRHAVYGRDGKSCVRCTGVIILKKQNQRSTYWCKNCQK